MKFQCSEEQGAFLFMNAPADKTQILASRSLIPFLHQNIDHWHEHMRNKHDLQIRRDQIIFVSGVTKTEDWGLGAFVRRGRGGDIAFNAQVPFFQGTFSLRSHRAQTGNVQYRTKPPPDDASSIRRQHPSVEGGDKPESELPWLEFNDTGSPTTPIKRDQTLFIHYSKIKVRWWSKLFKTARRGDVHQDREERDVWEAPINQTIIAEGRVEGEDITQEPSQPQTSPATFASVTQQSVRYPQGSFAGGFYQHRFRLNPQKAYSERMTRTRSDLRSIVKQRLSEITGESNAQMRWSRRAYMRDVVSRYRVRIEGWPLADIPFKNLSDIPNIGKVELLLARWRDGTTYFRRISQAEYDAMIVDPSPWIGLDENEGERPLISNETMGESDYWDAPPRVYALRVDDEDSSSSQGRHSIAIESTTNSPPSSSSFGDSFSENTDVVASEQVYDPVDVLLDYILNYPLEDGTEVQVAIASDLDLYALFDDEVPIDIEKALEKMRPPVVFVDNDMQVASLAIAEWVEV